MTFHIIRSWRNTKILRVWNLFCSHRGNSRFKHGSVIVNNIFAYFTLSLSAVQVYMIKERSWFSQIDFFIEYFSHLINVLFLSSQFHVASTYRDKDNPFLRKDIPNWKLSSNCVWKGFSQIVFPIIVLSKDDCTDSVQEERLGLRYWVIT